MCIRLGLALSSVGRNNIGSSKHLDGRIPFHAIILAEFGLLGAVDLDEWNVFLL